MIVELEHNMSDSTRKSRTAVRDVFFSCLVRDPINFPAEIAQIVHEYAYQTCSAIYFGSESFKSLIQQYSSELVYTTNDKGTLFWLH